MGICLAPSAEVAAAPSPSMSTSRVGNALPLPTFSRKTSAVVQMQRIPSASGKAATSHKSLTSDRPFAGYDYHVWTEMQNNNNNTSNVAEDAAAKATEPAAAEGAEEGAASKVQRSSSIAILQRISTQRMSSAADRVSLIDDYKNSWSGERRASARHSIGGRARGLSHSLNEMYAQLQNVAPRQAEEAKASYLQRIFALMDKDHRGSIPGPQLAATLFSDVNRASVDIMLAAADHDKDGCLSETEFVSFFIHVEDGDACLQADQNDAMMSSTSHSLSSDEVAKLSAEEEKSLSLQADGASALALTKAKAVRMRGVEVVNLESQSNRIKCIALSQDGELYAVAHRHDNVAHVCTLQGKEMRRLVGHQGSLLGISFSPDRKHVVTAARDNFLVSWDRTVGLECSFFEHPGIVTAVAVSWDGKFLYSGCQDNLLRKITASKSKLRATLPDIPCETPGVIVALGAQHTKNELVVFSRSCDLCAYLCSAHNLHPVAQLSGHDSLVWQTSFNADDSLLLTCCEQKIIAWSGSTYASLRVFSSAAIAAPTAGAEEVLWTTAVFGGKDFLNIIFCFNSNAQMHMLNCDDESCDSLLDLQLRSSVYTASSFVGDTMVCGDDNGNVYRVRLL